ncbi:MAG: hypothetical protein R3257_04475, partial [bacterium]|nr:hypothetical protein [bacterium]
MKGKKGLLLLVLVIVLALVTWQFVLKKKPKKKKAPRPKAAVEKTVPEAVPPSGEKGKGVPPLGK